MSVERGVRFTGSYVINTERDQLVEIYQIMAHKDRVERSDVEKAFAVCNPSDPLHIQVKDIKLVMRALGFEPRNAEIEKICGKMREETREEEREKGLVDLDHFIAAIADRTVDKSVDEMRCAFRLFDRESKGWISLENLRTVAQELGEKLGDDELMAMLKEAAGTEDKVTEDKFFDIMKKTSLY